MNKNFLLSIVKSHLFVPILGLFLILLFNLVTNVQFFTISLHESNFGNLILSGNLISILDNGSELAILAIGMTLVTSASGGQDISVGAAVAIAGSVILRVLCGTEARPEMIQAPIIVALLVGCVAAMLFGAFNGVLVAVFKIQPMIATLILFTAGRYIASWINSGLLPIVPDPKFGYFGNTIPGIPIPTPVFIAVACMILIALVLKLTNLGLYTQTVGINERTARLNGLNPVQIKILAFVIMGLCVAVAAFIKVSRLSTINYSVIAKDIEMDAILAVAIGGNALSGGKFSMVGSIIGAYTIQALTTTLYANSVPSDALPAYKAVVIIILVVASAPAVKEAIKKLWNQLTNKTSVIIGEET
jgi:simple sugar transport system permease protein